MQRNWREFSAIVTGRVYLDHAATTPILPAVRAAVAEAMTNWANPSSPHADGRAARNLLERARATVAEALEWPHDILFTSGASEALAIAGRRAQRAGRLAGATEHEAATAAMGAAAGVLPVDGGGIIKLDSLAAAVAEAPALVAIQQVNNETGVIQPLEAIAAAVRASGGLLLSDCAQSAGKLVLPEADFIAVSAHKLGGPPGIGALLVRDLATLEPEGGQEKGYRRGTQNLPAIAGFAAALATGAFRSAQDRFRHLRERLEQRIAGSGAVVIAGDSERSPAIGAYALAGQSSTAMLVQFDLAGIAVSAGSACSSGSMKPSRVLQAMEISPELASSTIRVSFGPGTSEAEVDAFAEHWLRIAQAARRSAA